MMYKRQAQHQELCVLRVSPEVPDVANVVITDGNASSDYTRFAPASKGLSIVDRDLTFAEFWADPDPIQKYRKGSAKCAEVLVPDKVNIEFIMGAYVSCQQALAAFQALGTGISVVINSHLFFR